MVSLTIKSLSYEKHGDWTSANRHSYNVPCIPNGARIAEGRWEFLATPEELYDDPKQLADFENRRDPQHMLYKKKAQEQVQKIILDAVEMTGNKNVVLTADMV